MVGKLEIFSITKHNIVFNGVVACIHLSICASYSPVIIINYVVVDIDTGGRATIVVGVFTPSVYDTVPTISKYSIVYNIYIMVVMVQVDAVISSIHNIILYGSRRRMINALNSVAAAADIVHKIAYEIIIIESRPSTLICDYSSAAITIAPGIQSDMVNPAVLHSGVAACQVDALPDAGAAGPVDLESVDIGVSAIDLPHRVCACGGYKFCTPFRIGDITDSAGGCAAYCGVNSFGVGTGRNMNSGVWFNNTRRLFDGEEGCRLRTWVGIETCGRDIVIIGDDGDADNCQDILIGSEAPLASPPQ